MRKLIVPAVLTLAVCAIAVYRLADNNALPLGSARTIGDVPPMSATEAASHRKDRYASIDSIENLLALPGHFARMEALYALAGRSGSAAVQNLVFQADGIADASDREDVLLVLFARLTELDAPSALALSRTPGFSVDPAFEREVWRRWGALDLDAALDHAAGLDRSSRNRAAQALFAAYDYWGSDEASVIAERLGVQPDNRTRSAHVDDLAHTDPATAIAYVHAIESPQHRRQAAAHLGRLLGQEGIEYADRWAALFEDPELRRTFQDASAQAAAEVDPDGTLERLLAEDAVRGSRLAGAFTAVAGQDIEQALLWLERLDNSQQRRLAGGAIAAQLARVDPLRALDWARENDQGIEMGLYRTVIGTLAETNPELAFNHVMSLDQKWHRMSGLMAITTRLSEHDPQQAAQLMSTVEDADARNMMVQQIATNWMQSDPEAALDWIMSSEVSGQDDLMTSAAHVVARVDVDAAVRLLPRLDKDMAPVWRQQIAANLAAQRSVAEAEGFVAQFEGTPEYPQLVGGVIQGLAQSDPRAAVEMLARAPETPDRFMLSTIVYMYYAQQSPRQAAEAAAAISDGNERENVMRQVLQEWAQSDPSAAERWADGQPSGPGRDSAIAGLSSQWNELTPRRRRMLESIADPAQRSNAIRSVVFGIAREDRDRAEQVLYSLNLSREEEQQTLKLLESVSQSSHSMFIMR